MIPQNPVSVMNINYDGKYDRSNTYCKRNEIVKNNKMLHE
jgi:hypothetical protein